ncbi:LPS assembly protein LptD [Candidatus Thioglobus sp.]|nr:LPS assembly protein LptD [Candidatus Thioglobus sp.]
MKKFLIFLILFVSHFSANANGVNLSCALDQNLCDRCPEYQTLFPLEKFSENLGSLDIEADESEILEDKYLLTGKVEVNSQNLFLSGDNMEISSADSSILASGNVKFQDESYLITSDNLSAARDGDNLIATATNANYQDYSAGLSGANGSSEIIEKNPSTVLLINSTYSLCPINQNNWLIDADKIELNYEKNRGLADNATLKFYGVPIFYTPKYSWVLSGRGSGFLTPSYSTYNEIDKAEDYHSLRVPYYFNLAPDRDLLLALNYMSSRRFIYEGKYRQLIAPKISPDHKDSIYSIEAKYLPEDKITGLKRWLVNFSEELDLSEKIHLSANYYRVSDSKYFEEVDRSNTDSKTLKSSLKYSYIDSDQNLSLSLLTEDEQVVNAGTPNYTKALEGSASKTINAESKMPIQLDLVSTRFAHDADSKESGTRTHGNMGISRELNIQYPKVTPRASIAITNYSLKNNPNINRTIFGSGLDIDFTTQKETSLFGYQVNHQISPIITYNYRAKKVQGNIPLFDSEDKYDDIISFADLTSGERYTGLDRITNANDITLSLESTYKKVGALDDDKNLLSMKIAQTYYADDEVVSDSTNTNYETRLSYSDIAASIEMAVNDFSISSAAQFNPKTSKVVKKENTIAYSPSSRKFISLSFIDEGTKETEKFYGAYPITDSIHVFGGLDKTTSTGVTNSETTGIGYESCCWSLRLAHFKDSTSSDKYNYGTRMELVLNGLGSTSSTLSNKIERKIPGYTANLR